MFKINKINKYIKLLLLIFFISFLFACTAPDEKNNDNSEYSFSDEMGNIVYVSKPKRVVSLFGSYAQMWQLSGGKVIAATNDAVNDREMNLGKNVQIIGTVKEPNLEKVISLNPDFVLLSADISSHIKAADTLKKSGIAFAFFKVEHFDDYLDMLDILTNITGRKDLYKNYGVELKNKIGQTVAKANKIKNKPSILYLRAFSTGIKSKGETDMVGTMLKDLGAKNIVSDHPSLLENLNIEQIILADPDFIFITTMGIHEEAIEEIKKSIFSNRALSNISALKNNRVIILDKEHFHYKPNHRWAESYEILYNYLYETK